MYAPDKLTAPTDPAETPTCPNSAARAAPVARSREEIDALVELYARRVMRWTRVRLLERKYEFDEDDLDFDWAASEALDVLMECAENWNPALAPFEPYLLGQLCGSIGKRVRGRRYATQPSPRFGRERHPSEALDGVPAAAARSHPDAMLWELGLSGADARIAAAVAFDGETLSQAIAAEYPGKRSWRSAAKLRQRVKARLIAQAFRAERQDRLSVATTKTV